MSTLELMIEDTYKDHGYMYNENVIHNVAEYIEMYNENKAEDEPTMTPGRWFSDTSKACPEEFVRKEDLYQKIADYFIEQRKLCIDQTGCLPCYDDWAQEMESEEFKNTIGEWADEVTITDFLNWLLDRCVEVPKFRI